MSPMPRLVCAIALPFAIAACSASDGTSDLGPAGGDDGGTTSPGDDAGGTANEGGTPSNDSGSASDTGAGTTEGGPGIDSGAPPDGGSTAHEGGVPDGGPTQAKIDYAPYFPTWVWGGSGYSFTGLADLQKKAGLNEVTIAFVLSNGGCNTTQDIEQNMSDVQAFVAAGGHLKASFGGADGAYVESQCKTASTWAQAIEDFVDATGITDLDFDIEQDPVLTDSVNKMRGQALALAQKAKGIKVAFTLAANPSPGGGLTSQGQSVVSNALAAGVVVSHVNLMTMDYGDSFGGMPLAPVVIGSLNDGHAQIMSLVPGISSATAWGMVGVIPMIGKNDDSEVFSLDDAKTLAQFAKTNQLGLVSFWSIDRDQPGTDYNNASTVESTNFAFDDILQAVTQ
jgi:chitinase